MVVLGFDGTTIRANYVEIDCDVEHIDVEKLLIYTIINRRIILRKERITLMGKKIWIIIAAAISVTCVLSLQLILIRLVNYE